MNETFNFNRFWTYFKYDLKQMWRNHSKPAILIGGAGIIFYVLWILGSLVFTQSWTAPPIVARFVVLLFAFMVLEFYQTRTYGYLTEKKAGSSWLMIPASGTEKCISMVLMTILVIPALFFAVYFLLDGFLSLVDPTYGKAMVTSFFSVYSDFVNGISDFAEESPILFTPASLVFPAIVSTFCNFLYFLLCGICFKKNKIVGAIAILFGISTLMSLLGGLIIPHLDLERIFSNLDAVDGQTAARWVVGLMNASVAFTCLLTIGLGWGVWRRIKTLQH
ncbi:MAG: hypothetical protein IJG35_05275 [Bacteroidales bacterium]|nr:hypothetical protein [Bacteroidales bacterium]